MFLDKDISFEDLTYSINGRVIIDKVSGTFHNKRLTGIMGNSGAGKTTLLNLLAGEIVLILSILLMDIKEGGEISGNMKVNDLDVSSSEIREFSGFLYQDEVILDTMTVMEAVHLE